MSELYLNIKRNSHVFSSFRDLYHVFINMGAFLMKEKLLDNDIYSFDGVLNYLHGQKM